MALVVVVAIDYDDGGNDDGGDDDDGVSDDDIRRQSHDHRLMFLTIFIRVLYHSRHARSTNCAVCRALIYRRMARHTRRS